jgi:hypothetical protein
MYYVKLESLPWRVPSWKYIYPVRHKVFDIRMVSRRKSAVVSAESTLLLLIDCSATSCV